jgi:hypothetical protein
MQARIGKPSKAPQLTPAILAGWVVLLCCIVMRLGHRVRSGDSSELQVSERHVRRMLVRLREVNRNSLLTTRNLPESSSWQPRRMTDCLVSCLWSVLTVCQRGQLRSRGSTVSER